MGGLLWGAWRGTKGRITMITYLLIALGGALGAIARFAMAGVIDRSLEDPFPLGTVLVNILGCFVIGFFAALTGPGARFAAPIDARHFFMVGVCGGFTTFSSFSLQTMVLSRTGEIFRAGANVVVSVIVCLVAVWIGSWLGEMLGAKPG
jgi:CrcB protein